MSLFFQTQKSGFLILKKKKLLQAICTPPKPNVYSISKMCLKARKWCSYDSLPAV